MRVLVLTSLAALAVAGAAPAAAQIAVERPSGVSADDLFRAFTSQGYELSEARADGSRRTQIELQGEAPVNILIRPVGCTSERDCQAVIIFANFDISNGVSDAQRTAVLRYNDTKYFGRAYALPDKVGIDSVVRIDSLSDFGYLTNRIKDFSKILPTFLKHMRDAAAANSN